MKIVTLDGDTLPHAPQRPQWCTDWHYRGTTSLAEIVHVLKDAEMVITNKVPLRQDTLRQLPALRYVCVAASNVPGYSTRSVAEGVMAFLFALRRHLVDYVNGTRTAWPASKHFCVHRQPIQDIYGAALGIIGKGGIGRAVGEMAQALGIKVLYADRQGSHEIRPGYTPFEQLLAQSDVLTLHCPLTPETKQFDQSNKVLTDR